MERKAALLVIAVSAGIFLLGGTALIRYYADFRAETALDDRLREIHDEILQEADEARTEAEGSDEERARHVAEELAAINPDYIGWLTLEDTELSYPVVQRDNAYYLEHDFEQKENAHGAIFLDGGCSEEFPVWLIHGHHMKDGTMFGSLKDLKKVAYLQEHTTLYFDAGDGDEEYRIYAAALIDFSNENEVFRSFHYEQLPLTEEEFESWQNNLKKYSYWYDADCGEALQKASGTLRPREILVLSTCEYGTEFQRLIIVAIKVS